MSSREYFSLRYAVPGFSFILIVVGLNYLPLLNILGYQQTSDSIGVLLSFLSLFAGSAIGFLVAQVWFAYYEWKRVYNKILKKMENILNKKLGLIIDNKGKDKELTAFTVIDYILLSENENKWKYCQRRFDSFHSLACTLTSLIGGVIVVLSLRVMYE